MVRWEAFFLVKKFEFQYFWCFRKKIIFFGHDEIVDFVESFIYIFGLFPKVKVQNWSFFCCVFFFWGGGRGVGVAKLQIFLVCLLFLIFWGDKQ